MIERMIIRGRRGQMTPDLIKQLQGEVGTDARIGKYLGISRQAVYQFRKLAGIPVIKDHHQTRNEKIYQKYRAGARGMKLFIEFNLSVSQLYRIIEKQTAQQGHQRVEPVPQQVPQEIHPPGFQYVDTAN